MRCECLVGQSCKKVIGLESGEEIVPLGVGVELSEDAASEGLLVLGWERGGPVKRFFEELMRGIGGGYS